MHKWRISAAIILAGLTGLAGCGTGPRVHALAPSGANSSTRPRPAQGGSTAASRGLPVSLELTNLWMSTARDGVGISPEGMYTTADGGRHWTAVKLPGPSLAALAQRLPSEIAASNLVTVGIAPEGIVWTVKQIPSQEKLDVYWTPNHGATWYGRALTTHLFSLGVPVWVQNMSFLGGHQAWLAIQPQHTMNSEPGDLWYSDSAGKTWRRIATTTPGAPSAGLPEGGAVSFRTTTQGWDMGSQTSTTANRLWQTQDGAQHWTPVVLPGYAPSRLSVITPPQFFGNQGILPVEYWPSSGKTADYATVLYRSTNGGHTWMPSTAVPASPSPIIDSISATTTWIWTGYQNNSYAGDPVYGVLAVTTNGGTHWSPRTPTGLLRRLMTQGYSITHLDFLNREQGWATTTKLDTSQNGPLLETHNGGRSWQRLNPTPVPSS